MVHRRGTTWAPSYLNAPLRDTQSRLVLKPSPSAFADFRKRGSIYTAPNVGASTARKSGLLRKHLLQRVLARALLSEQAHIALHRPPRSADHRLNRSCLRSAPSSKHRSNCIPSGNGSHAQSVSMIHCSVIRDPAGTRWAEAFARQVSFHAMGWIHLKNLPAQSCRRSPQHRSYWSDVRVALSRR